MPTIYCVEDDNGIRELISCALRSGGYGVKAFPMAKPFYEELETSLPSLILLDIMLHSYCKRAGGSADLPRI